MDYTKKILIVFASAGLGHAKAAKAVLEACQKYEPSSEVLMLDCLKLSRSRIGSFYSGIYYWQIQYAPWLWAFFYYCFDRAWVYFFIRRLRRLWNSFAARDLEKRLLQENPRVLIATHFMAAEVGGHLKKKGRIDSRIVVVVTDYMPHRVWMDPGVEAYCVALEETREALIDRGADPGKIYVTGIPIEEKFLTPASQRVSKDFTVLVTSGGAGIGTMEHIVDKILAIPGGPRVQVVCGHNQNLQGRLDAIALNNPRLRVFGFVNHMHELMDQSDVLVGKAGGLTLTESFSKRKPVIIFNPVPGQEQRNADMVLKYQAGYLARSASEVVDCVRHVWGDLKFREKLYQGTVRISRPESSRAIVEIANRAE